MKGITRPIDELGRVVIPKEMRNALEINAKDEVEIVINGDTITLHKVNKQCAFCGAASTLHEFNKKCICNDCINKIKNLSK